MAQDGFSARRGYWRSPLLIAPERFLVSGYFVFALVRAQTRKHTNTTKTANPEVALVNKLNTKMDPKF